VDTAGDACPLPEEVLECSEEYELKVAEDCSFTLKSIYDNCGTGVGQVMLNDVHGHGESVRCRSRLMELQDSVVQSFQGFWGFYLCDMKHVQLVHQCVLLSEILSIIIIPNTEIVLVDRCRSILIGELHDKSKLICPSFTGGDLE
jgi:hypothetical protein